jgi:hypothetical protein
MPRRFPTFVHKPLLFNASLFLIYAAALWMWRVICAAHRLLCVNLIRIKPGADGLA